MRDQIRKCYKIKTLCENDGNKPGNKNIIYEWNKEFIFDSAKGAAYFDASDFDGYSNVVIGRTAEYEMDLAQLYNKDEKRHEFQASFFH